VAGPGWVGRCGAGGGWLYDAGVIDTRRHLWDLGAREHRWLAGGQAWAGDAVLARWRRSFTLAGLIPLAAAAGAGGTVVIQAVAEPWETRTRWRWPRAATPAPRPAGSAAGTPVPRLTRPVRLTELAGVVGWVDLAAADCGQAIAGLRALPGGWGFVGIRHPVLAEPDPGWLACPAVLAGLAGDGGGRAGL
jgi:L-fuconolactonase